MTDQPRTAEADRPVQVIREYRVTYHGNQLAAAREAAGLTPRGRLLEDILGVVPAGSLLEA